MRKYLYYLVVAYAVAIIFEMNANFFFDGKLFQNPLWGIGFILWYGLFYSVMFILFRNRRLREPVIAGAFLGTLAEFFLFNRINIIFDPIIYAIMFFIPFWSYHRYFSKGKKSS